MKFKHDERNGIGSLIQLKSFSTMETDHMYGNNNSFFETSYKHHTKFDKEPILIEQESEFNNTLIFNVDIMRSEMLGNLMLMIRLPNIERFGYLWTNDIGHALVDHIRIINGDEELVKFTGDYLHTQYLLNTSSSHLNGINRMIGHYNTRYSLCGKSRVIYIPIPFMKSALDTQYYPVFLSSSKTFQIIVKIKPLRELVYVHGSDNIVKCIIHIMYGKPCIQLESNNINIDENPKLQASLLYDGIHLSKQERLLFQTKNGRLLYHTLQERTERFESRSSSMHVPLDFHGTVTHLLVYIIPTSKLDRNLYYEYYPLNTITLILNGVVVGDKDLPASKYRCIQPNRRIPSKWLYVIPFCLSCAQTQPSGEFTFYGRKNNTLIINRNQYIDLNCNVRLFAVTYNKLEFANSLISLR